ncbi:MAG: glycosyltransferase family 4 protein [Candidatus Methylomirabilales bacterium]
MRYSRGSNDVPTSTRLHVIPHGVDSAYFNPNVAWRPEDAATKDTAIVITGNMCDYKSQHGVLWFYREVWPRVRREIDEVRLYIVGNAPPSSLKRLAQEDGRVNVTGYVDDMRAYLWRANVIVSPLWIGTGIKNRVLEAMAMGKPVVATPVSVEGMQVEDGVDVLVAKDAAECANAIVRLCRERMFAESVGQNARRTVVRSYSWRASAEGLLEIIRTTVH